MQSIRKWINSFWFPRNAKDLEWLYKLNPTTPTHLPTSEEYRFISPGSQPRYQAPKNLQISQSHYYSRDTRRAYPQTLIFTNNDMTKLIGSETTSGENIVKTVPCNLPPILNLRKKYTLASFQQAFDGYNPEYERVVNKTTV